MEIKFFYDKEDDVLSVHTDVCPSETIEFTDFLNVDINSEKGVVGIEIFDASEFLRKQDKKITKEFLSNLKSIEMNYNDWRNVWFINLEFTDKKNQKITQKLPPLKKSEYTSPLINFG